jgi:hypothetical protein
VKLSALPLLEVRLRLFGRRRDDLSPNCVARSTQAQPAEQARPVSLAGTFDCYISVTGVQAEATIFPADPTKVHLRRFAATADNLRAGSRGLPTVARSRSVRWQPSGSRAEVGEYRARTGDLLVANQALSQLS